MKTIDKKYLNISKIYGFDIFSGGKSRVLKKICGHIERGKGLWQVATVNPEFVMKAKKDKKFVILTAGFKETGSEGANLEKQLAEITKKYEMNILGPNCLGFVNKNCPINATFAHVSDQSGNLRFISQSGAIAASLFDWCDSENLGFSEFVTLGNKTDINEVDVLNYFFNKNQMKLTH